MKKSLIFTFFILHFVLSSSAQYLSPQATFSLLTISPGSELYSIFGHAAYRFRDPASNIDWVYGYGAFDFRAEGFYIKFLRGTLPYELSLTNFNDEIPVWQEENRLVTERVLDLTTHQKNDLFNFLSINHLPQYRRYQYKFFYDNCSSRLRDVILRVCGKDSVKFSTTLHADSSYRQWIEHYSHVTKPWSEFGMDIAIGEPSDRKTGASGAMFLPDNLGDAFDSAKIYRNGQLIPLVLSKTPLNAAMLHSQVPESQLFTPMMVFWLFFVIVAALTFWQLYKPKRPQSSFSLLFDKVLFSVTGLAGWIFFFLWFFTNHGVTENNLNIIWAYPLLFPIALFLKKKDNRSWLAKHFFAYGIILIILLIVWNFLPQHLHPALIPLVLVLATRAFFVWWTLRVKLSSF